MIELTVIGGYLGAGKTTLLNEILDRTDGERIAVVVNDFGTVNIDAEILASDDGRTWEIANGCICCDLSDGMAAAIESIRNATPPVSRVFVEVSGVGSPEVVARWGDHPGFRRGGALVCADATSIRRDVNRKWVGETVRAQLRGADRLLLTKTDQVDEAQLGEIVSWLGSQPGVDAEIIGREEVLTGLPADRPADAIAADVDSAHAAAGHTSWSIATGSAVDPHTLERLVSDLPETVVRAKGILADSRRPGHRFLVQYDGTRCEISAAAPDGRQAAETESGAAADAAKPGRLVIIAAGAHVDTPEAVTTLAHALHGWVGD